MSTLHRRVKAQTKRRQSHVNAGTVPETKNVGTQGRHLTHPPFVNILASTYNNRLRHRHHRYMANYIIYAFSW